VCVCVRRATYHVSTACHISLGGEGNALYPMLSGCYVQVAEETQEAVMEVREDDNVNKGLRHISPTTPATKNGDVENGMKQKAGSKVIVSHSPEGSIARVVSSPEGSISRLSSIGSGYSYSVSPDGSSVSRPASNATGLRQVSVVG